MVRIVQRNRHIGIAQGLAGLRARKNNVLHRRPPKLLDSLFPKHPADSVRHIAFAAAVGSHNSRYPVMKLKDKLVCKGFKSLNFNTL